MKRYLQIVLIVVLSLFHRSVIVVLNSKNFDFKTMITAAIGDVSFLKWFSTACFSKKVEKSYVELYSIKERFNKIEIETDLENESQLKRIRKPPLLLSQEESLAEKFKKYPSLLDKTYKERDVLQKFSLNKSFALFSRFVYFFRSIRIKITSCQTLGCPSCVTIIATIAGCDYQYVFRWNINIVRVVIIVDLGNNCNRCFTGSANQPLISFNIDIT